MTDAERKIAIWPQYSDKSMEQKRQAALRFLGGSYLLAEPINAKQKSMPVRASAA